MIEKYYRPGTPIVLRESWDGKIWTARPMIIVQDTPELLVLYIAPNTRWQHGRNQLNDHISAIERKNHRWMLEELIWRENDGYLRLTIPKQPYSVIIFWNNDDNSIRRWYINLEDPLYRTKLGFDYTDLILDLIIKPNLRDWHWDDEDELKEAMDLGLISEEQGRALYKKGAEVRDMIMSGKSVFNGWENWRPDPRWKVPVLPDGWDVV